LPRFCAGLQEAVDSDDGAIDGVCEHDIEVVVKDVVEVLPCGDGPADGCNSDTVEKEFGVRKDLFAVALHNCSHYGELLRCLSGAAAREELCEWLAQHDGVSTFSTTWLE
jgi:hypothetical protein